jgi:two-component system, cell cycle response regulator
MRKEECIARMSETEFALICPSTALSNANLFANRLKEAVAAAKVNFKEEVIRFTASVGVANTDQDMVQSVEELFAMAEGRMHRARDKGGNTMVSSDELQTFKPPGMPSIDEALHMLAAGDTERVSVHAPSILTRLLPLMKLLNQRLELKLPLEGLDDPAKPKE